MTAKMSTTIEISNGTLTATIHSLGAELISLKDSSREYIWQADPKYWPKHSPVLFPIVGGLKNDSYLYKGKIHAMNRHGFARDNTFNLKSQTEDSAVFTLVSNNDTRVMYPFDFELEMRYALNGSTLSITYVVTNHGKEEMPFSIGAHPAFALPKKFGDYSLKFEKDEPLESRQLSENLITDTTVTHQAENGVLPLDYKLFEKDALVFTNLQSRSVKLIEGDRPILEVSYQKFPHLGIWTKENAPFICIEPWQGYADKSDATGNIIEKEGILKLSPGAQYNAAIEIQIES
jgi:galactose mutarotase-like enzyme